MDKQRILDDIFQNDPFGLLNVKPSNAPVRTEDERLIASFEEINDFFAQNQREPQPGADIQERQLYSRLKSLRENPAKQKILADQDKYGLLHFAPKEINSLEDILNDDSLGLLDDDGEGLFDFKHLKNPEERASTDFVARRKPCKDFKKYEPLFQAVQVDLANAKRKLVAFKEENLRAGDFYIHNGILLYLEQVDFQEAVQLYKSGSRLRKDGRTRVIFENGTESNMLYRSLYKGLLANGKAVSANEDQINAEFIENFNSISAEDEEAGFIYVLKSQSEKTEIRAIRHLYKIGYSKTAIEERIKNARSEPTYLMADVRIVMAFKCYNMNPQKLEQLLHIFFGNACLNIDIYDEKSNRHTPREWFIAPLSIIEQAIHLIISGDILKYNYDAFSEEIIAK